MIIPECSMEDWLQELKQYQSKSMSVLLENMGPDEAAQRWLSADGPGSTIKFGGESGQSSEFYERFRGEFKKFLCGDDSYSEHRKQLTAETPVARNVFVSAISAALGATLGTSATLLAPAIVVMLYLVATMGLNAWCSLSEKPPEDKGSDVDT